MLNKNFIIFLLPFFLSVSCLDLKSGDFIQLKVLGRVVRVDPSSANNNRLITNGWGGWFHGSTFKLTLTSDNKWQLKSLINKFVCADGGGGGNIYANRDSASGWESFSVQWVSGTRVNLQSSSGKWLGVSADSDEAVLMATSASPNSWETFEVVKVPSIRGVNLGSWFVPEGWMVDLYSSSNANSLCDLVRKVGRSQAETLMIQHLNTWITESDFQWLQSQGINMVRIPIGYWNVINDPYSMFVPKDPSVSLTFIDKAFDLAAKYGMQVLLDLHGGPGSQQGADHSGCVGPTGWNTQQNIQLSIDTIKALAARYSSRSNLFGFELLNEPGWDLENTQHSALSYYYQQAYWWIRSYTTSAVVVINCLYGNFYDQWNKEMTEDQGFYNVFYDRHMYDCFGDNSHVSTQQHITNAYNWAGEMLSNNMEKPVIVGEWSMATGDNPGGQAFLDAELSSWGNTMGWFFWNYKLASDKTNSAWSFRTAIESGYRF